MDIVNARFTQFPDGARRLNYMTHPREVKTQEEKTISKVQRQRWLALREELFENDFEAFVDLFGVVDDEKPEWLVERYKSDAVKRAKQKVYDIARSNRFDLFLTLTFDPEKVNSYDYSACVDRLESFTKFLRRHGCQYVLVPEKHDSGRYHFHGLCTRSDIQLIQAVSPYTGALLYDEKGRKIYNLPQYSLGFSTATLVSEPAKTASYLCKYLTKEIEVPKGKKCYWASRSCSRPTVERTFIEESELAEFVEDARFVKVTLNDYGHFLIAENENAVV